MLFLLITDKDENRRLNAIKNAADTFSKLIKAKKAMKELPLNSSELRKFIQPEKTIEVTFYTEFLKEERIEKLFPSDSMQQNPNRIFITSVDNCNADAIYKAIDKKKCELALNGEKSQIVCLHNTLTVQGAENDALNVELIGSRYILAAVKQMLAIISQDNSWENIFSI